MRCVGVIHIAIAGVFDNVALVVRNACSPISTVVTNHLADDRVAVAVERQCLVGPHRRTGQRHVDAGRVSLRRLQRTLQTLGILLGEDGLLVHLVVDSVGEEVAARHEVGGALNCAVANNGDLRCTRWRSRQRHKARAVGVDRHRVVGGQRQQRVVTVNRNVTSCQDLKCEVVRTCAAGRINHSTGHV